MRTNKATLAILAAMAAVATMASGCTIEDWDYTWNGHGIGTNYDGELSFALIEPNKGAYASAGDAPPPRSGQRRMEVHGRNLLDGNQA